MSSVDNRIVNMQFNNKQFVSGAEDSAQALDSLESSISNMSDGSGLQDVGSAVDSVAGRFGALQVAGVAALATIAAEATHTALAVGQNLLSSITSTIFGAGFQRAIDIQQAKFQFRGLGLDVQQVMGNALDAVKGTAFGLQEAATAATQFGGSGVKAGKDMTTALTAISGIAAQTGRSYTEIAQVMTGIAGVGKLTGQDIIQFGVRGLDVLGPLADALGKTRGQIQQMVSDGEIDFKTFAKVMNDTFGKNATKANQTFTGALANMKAALSRLGAQIFTPMIKTAGDLFNLLTKKIDAIHDELNPLINAFSQFSRAVEGGIAGLIKAIDVPELMNDLVHGFRHIIKPLIAIFDALGDAWSQVFPDDGANAGRSINNIANAFRILTLPLKWLAEQIPKLIPVFVVFFEILKVGWTIVSGLYKALSGLAKQAADVGGNIISGLTEGLSADAITAKIVEIANNIIDTIKDVLGIHSPAESMIEVGTNIIMGIIDGLQAAVGFLWQTLGTLATGIIDGIGNALSNLSAGDIAGLINAALVGGILLAIRGIIKTISGFADQLQKISTTVSAPFDLLTQSLKVMQTQVRAELIKQIAIAVGILTVSLIALSLVPAAKLGKGLGFLSAELALIIGAMAALGKINPENIIASATAIVLISGSLILLTIALAGLALIPADQIGKALTTMAIALTLMIGAVEFLGTLGPQALAGAGSIFIVATAMVALAAAVGAFALIPADQVGKALTTLALSLVLIVAAIAGLGSIGPMALAGAGSIFIVAEAMIVLAAAVFAFSKINPDQVGKALTTMAIALVEVVAALALTTAIGPEVLASAGAIIVMALAMKILADAIAVMAGVGPEAASQGLTTMAVALGIFLAAAAIAAIGPVSVGLGVLALSMLTFGAGVALLGVGLLAAATAFTLFSTVFAAGTAVIVAGITTMLTLLPQLAKQLATALIVFIETIAEAVPRLRDAFGKIISGILGTIRDAIPDMRKTANELLNALFSVLHQQLPNFRRLVEDLIRSGLHVIRTLFPDFVQTGVDLIMALLQGIRKNLDNFIDVGTNIVDKFIRGIGDSGTKLLRTTVDTLIKFGHDLADTIRTRSEEFGDVGRDIAGAIVEGLVNALGAQAAFDALKTAAENLANALPGWMRAVLEMASPSKVSMRIGRDFVLGLVLGISDNVSKAVNAAIILANAVVAAGDKAIREAQNKSRKEQIKAAKKQARADLADRFAREAEKEARQNPKNKALQKAAKDARDRADKQQKAADEAQKRADAAAQHVSDVQAFRDADKQGKADILRQRADELADRSIKKLAEANAAARAAKKATGKERDRLQQEAKKDAAAAKHLANQSRKDQRRADDFEKDAVINRIKSIKKQREAEAKAAREQEKFDNSSVEEQIAILQSRADAAEKRAKAERKQSEALVHRARQVAKKDAERAQKLLDQSERLAQKAKDDADKADEARSQADDLTNQDTGSSVTPQLNISRSALEDAASAIDRYTKSLIQAEEAALATTPVVQFVQNNTSPESLSDTTIYRNTKNLLSVAEIKMGAPAPTG